MRTWNLLRNASGLKCRYTYGHDKRYQLRRMCEMSGQRKRCIWALHLGDQRIWEVHAMADVRYVMDDAQDYIMAARMAG